MRYRVEWHQSSSKSRQDYALVVETQRERDDLLAHIARTSYLRLLGTYTID